MPLSGGPGLSALAPLLGLSRRERETGDGGPSATPSGSSGPARNAGDARPRPLRISATRKFVVAVAEASFARRSAMRRQRPNSATPRNDAKGPKLTYPSCTFGVARYAGSV